MDEESKEITEKPQRKRIDVDGFVNGASKILSFGEVPDDPVIKGLKRFNGWLKHILITELMLTLVVGLPSYGVYKIKRGEVDDLADVVVKVADVAFAENASPSDVESENPILKTEICPECGSDDIEIWDTTEDVWVWKCRQCGNVFKEIDDDEER